MNDISIQNVAKNMMVSTKQHSLFHSVCAVNPPMVKSDNPMPGMNNMSGMPNGMAMQVYKNPNVKIINIMPIPKRSCSLNSHLYGSLSPCEKQYML